MEKKGPFIDDPVYSRNSHIYQNVTWCMAPLWLLYKFFACKWPWESFTLKESTNNTSLNCEISICFLGMNQKIKTANHSNANFIWRTKVWSFLFAFCFFHYDCCKKEYFYSMKVTIIHPASKTVRSIPNIWNYSRFTGWCCSNKQDIFSFSVEYAVSQKILISSFRSTTSIGI